MHTAQPALVTCRVSLTLATCRLVGAALLISAVMAALLQAVGLLVDGQGMGSLAPRHSPTPAAVGRQRTGSAASSGAGRANDVRVAPDGMSICWRPSSM